VPPAVASKTGNRRKTLAAARGTECRIYSRQAEVKLNSLNSEALDIKQQQKVSFASYET